MSVVCREKGKYGEKEPEPFLRLRPYFTLYPFSRHNTDSGNDYGASVIFVYDISYLAKIEEYE